MSKRAEEAALKAYPPTYTTVKRHAKRVQSERTDTHQSARAIFRQGYEQAERDLADAFQAKYAKELARADLALTWTDMKRVVHTYYVMQYEALSGELDVKFESDEFYKELLKRFNENKI